jgi:hypothetical protein
VGDSNRVVNRCDVFRKYGPVALFCGLRFVVVSFGHVLVRDYYSEVGISELAVHTILYDPSARAPAHRFASLPHPQHGHTHSKPLTALV